MKNNVIIYNNGEMKINPKLYSISNKDLLGDSAGILSKKEIYVK
jgi:hypothetical protein